MEKKKYITATVAATVAILALTACTPAEEEPTPDTRTPINIGNLQVQGETSTRAIADWTEQYEAFSQGDELTVEINPGVNSISRTYQYQPNGTWSSNAPFYQEDLPATIDEIQAWKGSIDLEENQSTLESYREADYIVGYLELDGTELSNAAAPDDKLYHLHVDIVITITPTANSDHWAGIDFITYMRNEATVLFLTKDGTEVTPFLAEITPQGATYRAVMPIADVPEVDDEFISITAPNAKPVTGKLTSLDDTPAPGTRLTITMEYDNKRLLNPTATVTPWTNGPNYNAQHSAYHMIIRNAADLAAFRDLVNSDYPGLTAIQVADITLTGENWEPIGTDGKPFTGTYNGGGYTITGLTITVEENEEGEDYQGLFGHTSGATLTNIHLRGANVTGKNNVGTLVGSAGTHTHISYCSAVGTVTGSNHVGGLVGGSVSTIVASYANATVTATAVDARIGGLAGSNNLTTIAFCHAAGTVTNENAETAANIGGLVGLNLGTIASCYATATVIATAGGRGSLVGSNYNIIGGTITYSHAPVTTEVPDLVGVLGIPTIPRPTNCSTTTGQAGITVRGFPNPVDPNKITVPTGLVEKHTFTAGNTWAPDGAEPRIIGLNYNN